MSYWNAVITDHYKMMNEFRASETRTNTPQKCHAPRGNAKGLTVEVNILKHTRVQGIVSTILVSGNKRRDSSQNLPNGMVVKMDL